MISKEHLKKKGLQARGMGLEKRPAKKFSGNLMEKNH